jgi:hypothetical protein
MASSYPTPTSESVCAQMPTAATMIATVAATMAREPRRCIQSALMARTRSPGDAAVTRRSRA